MPASPLTRARRVRASEQRPVSAMSFRSAPARDAERHAPDVTLPTDAARLPARRAHAASAPDSLAFAALSLAVHGGAVLCVLARAGAAREHRRRGDLGRDRARRERDRRAPRQTPGEDQITQPLQTIRRTRSRPSRSARPSSSATEQPQTVQVGPQETAPEQETALERQADEADAGRATRPRRASSAAAGPVEARDRDGHEPRSRRWRPPRRARSPPDTMDVSLLPQPEEKPVETAEPKPAEPTETKPVEQETGRGARSPSRSRCRPRRQAGEERRARPRSAAASMPRPARRPTREAKAPQSDRRLAGSGRGAGHSSRDSNYRGLVSAHLRRHKQYPADARARGDRGSATVTFSLERRAAA